MKSTSPKFNPPPSYIFTAGFDASGIRLRIVDQLRPGLLLCRHPLKRNLIVLPESSVNVERNVAA